MSSRRGKTGRAYGFAGARYGEVILDNVPSGGSPSWAMLYPAEYAVGMANLGFQSICAELRTMGVGVERFFQEKGTPRSVESCRSINNFPFVSASIAYEPDLVSIINIFSQWGISPNWDERESRGDPVFGVGGALSYINPLIFSGIADYVVLGDGEPVLEYLVGECRKYMSHGDRHRLWEKLSEHPSIFVPPLHRDRILSGKSTGRKKSFVSDMDSVRGKSLWVSGDSVFGKTILVELQRGCRRGCSYCTIPSSFGPVRIRSLEKVTGDIAGFKDSGNLQVGLVTPEAGDYPHIRQLLEYLRSAGQAVSFASLRVDNMTEEMIEALVRSGRYSVTVAPEAGKDWLRFSCGKNFSNDLIIERLSMARRVGVRQVKLYFMTGLPGEEMEDVDAIPELCREIHLQTGLKVRASIGLFVPKPMSRWGMEPICSPEAVKARFRRLRTLFSKDHSRGYLASFQDENESFLEHSISWFGAGNGSFPGGLNRRAMRAIIKEYVTDKESVREQLENLGF
ncbi:MAG TPA: radical SAM protein [Synergistales bacterium]|nr:radical SAM protein [Synergistales bacterium]HRV70547.1 radical SAM protein [Thermovirgaceae bacterium]